MHKRRSMAENVISEIKRSENTHGVRHCVTLSQVDLVAKQLSMPLLRQDTLEWELSQQYQNT